MFLHNSRMWENPGSWDMDQNSLSQSDCRIFISAISPEQIDEIAWFFAFLCKFMKIKSLLKMFCVGMVKNRCGHSCPSHDSKIGCISWWNKLIFCMLIKARNYFNNLWMRIVKIWAWPFSSLDLKTCCISRMNLWMEMIFCMLMVV